MEKCRDENQETASALPRTAVRCRQRAPDEQHVSNMVGPDPSAYGSGPTVVSAADQVDGVI